MIDLINESAIQIKHISFFSEIPKLLVRPTQKWLQKGKEKEKKDIHTCYTCSICMQNV